MEQKLWKWMCKFYQGSVGKKNSSTKFYMQIAYVKLIGENDENILYTSFSWFKRPNYIIEQQNMLTGATII